MLFILPTMLKGFWSSTLADYSKVRGLWSFPTIRYLKLHTLTFFENAEPFPLITMPERIKPPGLFCSLIHLTRCAGFPAPHSYGQQVPPPGGFGGRAIGVGTPATRMRSSAEGLPSLRGGGSRTARKPGSPDEARATSTVRTGAGYYSRRAISSGGPTREIGYS